MAESKLSCFECGEDGVKDGSSGGPVYLIPIMEVSIYYPSARRPAEQMATLAYICRECLQGDNK